MLANKHLEHANLFVWPDVRSPWEHMYDINSHFSGRFRQSALKSEGELKIIRPTSAEAEGARWRLPATLWLSSSPCIIAHNVFEHNFHIQYIPPDCDFIEKLNQLSKHDEFPGILFTHQIFENPPSPNVYPSPIAHSIDLPSFGHRKKEKDSPICISNQPIISSFSSRML